MQFLKEPFEMYETLLSLLAFGIIFCFPALYWSVVYQNSLDLELKMLQVLV